MNRRFIFKHYWWIALLAGVLCLWLVIRYAPRNQASLAFSVVAASLGFCYFVQQQKLAETRLFKELFTEFNHRYDQMNEQLADLIPDNPGQETLPQPQSDERKLIVDYLNLCAEEYLFYSEGYIHEQVWQSWCQGMLHYLENEPFKSVWEAEIATGSYYNLTLETIRRAARASERLEWDAQKHDDSRFSSA